VIAPRRPLCSAKQPPYRTRWTRGKGTKAASFSKGSTGERVMPVVPSDQGVVKVYTRSPLVSSARRSSATAPRAVTPFPATGARGSCQGVARLLDVELALSPASRFIDFSHTLIYRRFTYT
jgi:hypothetical protein